MLTHSAFKFTWSSGLVVPHVQVHRALCRLHGLAAILDSAVTQRGAYELRTFPWTTRYLCVAFLLHCFVDPVLHNILHFCLHCSAGHFLKRKAGVENDRGIVKSGAHLVKVVPGQNGQKTRKLCTQLSKDGSHLFVDIKRTENCREILVDLWSFC